MTATAAGSPQQESGRHVQILTLRQHRVHARVLALVGVAEAFLQVYLPLRRLRFVVLQV